MIYTPRSFRQSPGGLRRRRQRRRRKPGRSYLLRARRRLVHAGWCRLVLLLLRGRSCGLAPHQLRLLLLRRELRLLVVEVVLAEARARRR